MTNPRETRTNAADSAPGVDDGRAGVPPPPVDSKPKGRLAVWIAVLAVAVIVLAMIFMPRTDTAGDERAAVNPGMPRGDVAAQTADQPQPAQPVNPQPGGY